MQQQPLLAVVAILVAMATTIGMVATSPQMRRPAASSEATTCSWRVLACSANDGTANSSCQLTDAEFCTCCLYKALKQSTRPVGPGGPCPTATGCNEATMYGAWCPWAGWTACAPGPSGSGRISSRRRDCSCPAPFLRPAELTDGRAGCQPEAAANETVACAAWIFSAEAGAMLAVFLAGSCLTAVPIAAFLCYIRRRLDRGGGGGGGGDRAPPMPTPTEPQRPRRGSDQQRLRDETSNSSSKQPKCAPVSVRLVSYDRSPLHSISTEELDRRADF